MDTTTSEPTLGEILMKESNVDNVAHKLSKNRNDLRKKRANKNRPREESSKIPVKPLSFHNNIKKKQLKLNSRDPRFDSLCGTYSEKFFHENYNFLDEIKQREKKELEESLKNENDNIKREQIKFLLKRMKDQERENDKKKKNLEKRIKQSEKLKKNLLEGKPAHFKTKTEKKVSDLIEKYEELKSKGKVQSYMKKKLKKNKRQKGTPFEGV
ncbi:hypothetical protein O3M35_007740 [Rhynocoris fuscipes]|uniref:rRNA biogenesis protein RRP36 n=1 Tax=Rhynocoris fuscipes TaxID=488301 RepID=A0AAW1DBA0_9HEMI